MIRTICKPDSTQFTLTLTVPPSYVGEDLELQLFPLEEVEEAHQAPADERRPVFGCLKGQIWMADDFDAPLEEFKEYM
jgi:hypothetical protein